jgi:hypothetical protein
MHNNIPAKSISDVYDAVVGHLDSMCHSGMCPHTTIEYSGRHALLGIDEDYPSEYIIQIPARYRRTLPGTLMLLHEMGHLTQTLSPYPVNNKRDKAGMILAILWYENDAWDNALIIAEQLHIKEMIYKEYLIDRKKCVYEYTKSLMSYPISAVRTIYSAYALGNQVVT